MRKFKHIKDISELSPGEYEEYMEYFSRFDEFIDEFGEELSKTDDYRYFQHIWKLDIINSELKWATRYFSLIKSEQTRFQLYYRACLRDGCGWYSIPKEEGQYPDPSLLDGLDDFNKLLLIALYRIYFSRMMEYAENFLPHDYIDTEYAVDINAASYPETTKRELQVLNDVSHTGKLMLGQSLSEFCSQNNRLRLFLEDASEVIIRLKDNIITDVRIKSVNYGSRKADETQLEMLNDLRDDGDEFLSCINNAGCILAGEDMADYYFGATKDKSIIYWQIDERNRIRTGKIMQYDPVTGKRVKNASGAIDWVHAKLKRDGILSGDFNLVQCLFGEHLLKRYPDKVVALVESEKSALIGAGVYPGYLWLATGGRSQLSIDKLRVLRGRTVVMFPDVDGYDLWREKAKLLETAGCKVVISDLLEKNASPADRDAKIDLADWLIWQLQTPSPEAKIGETEQTGTPVESLSI